MASEAKRRAAAIIVRLIDGWWAERVDHKQPEDPGEALETRVELLRLKETFERVEWATEDPHPEGWTEGNPGVAPCNCNECVDRKVKAAKEAGRLKDPNAEGETT